MSEGSFGARWTPEQYAADRARRRASAEERHRQVCERLREFGLPGDVANEDDLAIESLVDGNYQRRLATIRTGGGTEDDYDDLAWRMATDPSWSAWATEVLLGNEEIPLVDDELRFPNRDALSRLQDLAATKDHSRSWSALEDWGTDW